jgi:hypothetical protein
MRAVRRHNAGRERRRLGGEKTGAESEHERAQGVDLIFHGDGAGGKDVDEKPS